MPAPTTPPTPDTAPRTVAAVIGATTAPPTSWPYRPGDHAQMLYMSDRETVLADSVIRAVTPHPDGGWVVTAILSDPRSVFALTPDATHAALLSTDPRVTVGTDHTRRSA